MRINNWRNAILAAAAIVLAAVFILLAMGRNPFCPCGITRLWSGDIWSEQNSQQLFDPYTFTHIIHGAGLYALLWMVAGNRIGAPAKFVLATGLESGWEIFENTDFVINRYREATLALNYYGDSVLNSTGDILAMFAGVALARSLPVRLSVAAMVILDLSLVWLIRDSLILNIIMLLFPIDAIREWQLR